MSTISTKVVKARKQHRCANCHQPILPGHYYVRLFGSMEGDPPYVIRLCDSCDDRAPGHDPRARVVERREG